MNEERWTEWNMKNVRLQMIATYFHCIANHFIFIPQKTVHYHVKMQCPQTLSKAPKHILHARCITSCEIDPSVSMVASLPVFPPSCITYINECWIRDTIFAGSDRFCLASTSEFSSRWGPCRWLLEYASGDENMFYILARAWSCCFRI